MQGFTTEINPEAYQVEEGDRITAEVNSIERDVEVIDKFEDQQGLGFRVDTAEKTIIGPEHVRRRLTESLSATEQE